MASLDTDHLLRCIHTLESSVALLEKAEPESIEREIFRNAVVKGFELTLETAGKLLRRALKAFAATPRTIDELVYKDVLRHGAKHGLLSDDEVRRWIAYRDNRNSTAHDYGAGFAEETLKLLPGFIEDAKRLEATLRARLGHGET